MAPGSMQCAECAFDLRRNLLVEVRGNVESDCVEHEAAFVKGDEAAQIAWLLCQSSQLLAAAGRSGIQNLGTGTRLTAWPRSGREHQRLLGRDQAKKNEAECTSVVRGELSEETCFGRP